MFLLTDALCFSLQVAALNNTFEARLAVLRNGNVDKGMHHVSYIETKRFSRIARYIYKLIVKTKPVNVNECTYGEALQTS